jgi:hypothetical protein
VINLGLDAGILTPLVFAMFVFHALVLTFATTPVTAWIMPEKHRLRLLIDSPSSSHTTLDIVDAKAVDARDREEKAVGMDAVDPASDSQKPVNKSQERVHASEKSRYDNDPERK